MKSRKALGAFGERLAREHLKQHGYRIIETNYRSSYGEMDIVAEKDGCLVFLEVRTRRGEKFGTPAESITPGKKERLINIANDYLQTHDNLPAQWRIDVVCVEVGTDGRPASIELIENAIS